MIDIKIAGHRAPLWIAAFLLTFISAFWQRISGPTYPVRVNEEFAGTSVKARLLRTEIVGTDTQVAVFAPDTAVSGFVKYKRYKSRDEWTRLPLARDGDELRAALPAQPMAGKIIYFVQLQRNGDELPLTGSEPIILRYRGPVPIWVMLPHVLFIFLAMLLSTRAGFEALDSRGAAKKYMFWAIGIMFIGGFIMGPLMQKFAFNAYWTGFPFGTDLTDNKTLIAMIFWLWAWFKNRGVHLSRGWILLAALVTLVVFLIPHSLLGSELDYSELPN